MRGENVDHGGSNTALYLLPSFSDAMEVLILLLLAIPVAAQAKSPCGFRSFFSLRSPNLLSTIPHQELQLNFDGHSHRSTCIPMTARADVR